jgi:hypothetical protein
MFCECGNESSGSINFWEVLELHNWWPLAQIHRFGKYECLQFSSYVNVYDQVIRCYCHIRTARYNL